MPRRSEREEGFRIEIEPIEQLPPVRKMGKRIEAYDNVLNQFLSSELRICRVKVTGKNVKSVYQALADRIDKEQYPIKLHLISGELFLEKT